jgi:hypothetical protein
MRIARVFPQRTKATPTDKLAFTDAPGMFPPEVDAVHISVAFDYDLPVAEWLAKQWQGVAPVTIGGPATGSAGDDFTPGLYLRHGYTITSRGCPNRCWFCRVWQRDGNTVRELPIKDGYIVQDDNLLACSENHIRAVFAMLARQKHRPIFHGGLEAARMKLWIAFQLSALKPDQMFFAYDTPDDYEPLVECGKMMQAVEHKRDKMRCYVLCGYRGDTLSAAEKRMRETWAAGYFPFAMLYDSDKQTLDWRKFHRLYCRPACTRAILGKQTAAANAPRTPLKYPRQRTITGRGEGW